VIGLCHNPDAAPQLAKLGACYVLAGHTHGKAVADTAMNNMLFPTRYKNLAAGEHDLGGGRKVYINRGIGSGRRGSAAHRSEITVFTLRSTLPVRKSRSFGDDQPARRLPLVETF